MRSAFTSQMRSQKNNSRSKSEQQLCPTGIEKSWFHLKNIAKKMVRLINQGKSLKIAKLMRMETSAADKEPHNDCIIQSPHLIQF